MTNKFNWSIITAYLTNCQNYLTIFFPLLFYPRLAVEGEFRHLLLFKLIWRSSVNGSLLGIKKKDKDRREGKGRRCCLGDGINSIHCRIIAIFHQDDSKKRMNRKTTTWRNGWFEQIDDHPVHSIPNHHSTKTGVIPRTFVQLILAAIWLMQ